MFECSVERAHSGPSLAWAAQSSDVYNSLQGRGEARRSRHSAWMTTCQPWAQRSHTQPQIQAEIQPESHSEQAMWAGQQACYQDNGAIRNVEWAVKMENYWVEFLRVLSLEITFCTFKMCPRALTFDRVDVMHFHRCNLLISSWVALVFFYPRQWEFWCD